MFWIITSERAFFPAYIHVFYTHLPSLHSCRQSDCLTHLRRRKIAEPSPIGFVDIREESRLLTRDSLCQLLILNDLLDSLLEIRTGLTHMPPNLSYIITPVRHNTCPNVHIQISSEQNSQPYVTRVSARARNASVLRLGRCS